MWSDVIPFLGRKEKPLLEQSRKWQPLLNVSLDRKVYRPGDVVTALVEIRNVANDLSGPIVVQELLVGFRGVEKLDQQWIAIPKSTKQNKGERLFLESHGRIESNSSVEHDSSGEYFVRTTLPKLLPPTYRGTSVRYFYYVTVKLQWSFKAIENGHVHTLAKQFAVPMEKRVSLTVWIMPNFSGLTVDEFQLKENCTLSGIVPASVLELAMYWKEKNDHSEWSRASGALSSIDDDISSQGSDSVAQSPVKGVLEHTFERSLTLSSPSLTRRESRELNRGHSRRASLTGSSSETCMAKDEGLHIHTPNSLHRSSSENCASWNRSVVDDYLSEQEDNGRAATPLGHFRGKAYNIRIDDQVLVQVSPKNPDATYYFGDTVAGVLTFPADGGLRKCLEVSAVLEVREILNPSYLHPSRKNSQVISKVQSEYHEVVADVSQTHYIFSIPLDGPASFSTPHITVQWLLRFEFSSTPANVDWSKYESVLQIKERDRGEWTLPITVHAPLPRAHGAARKERPVSSLRDFWLQSPKSLESPHGSPLAGPSNGHL